MKGKITISRQSSNFDDPTPIHIGIEDVNSCIEFLEVSMSLEDFATAITGQGRIDCNIETRGLDKIGSKREHKTIIIDAGKYQVEKDDAIKLVAPFEDDGWIARVEDLQNPHNLGKGGYRVLFERWVR